MCASEGCLRLVVGTRVPRKVVYAWWYGPRCESSERDALSSAAASGAGRRVSAEGRAAMELRERTQRKRREKQKQMVREKKNDIKKNVYIYIYTYIYDTVCVCVCVCVYVQVCVRHKMKQRVWNTLT